MKANFNPLIAQLPLSANNQWPAGVPFINAFSHGTMSVELFAPNELDRQTPHEQDELYFVWRGGAIFELNGIDQVCEAGDVLFVPAGAPHHFHAISKDFATWVVFWGVKGGESNQAVEENAG